MSYRHGTYAGYQQHRKRGEDACTPCLNALADYTRARRARLGTADDKLRNTAYRTASARLREAHRAEFDAYCYEELAKLPAQREAS